MKSLSYIYIYIYMIVDGERREGRDWMRKRKKKTQSKEREERFNRFPTKSIYDTRSFLERGATRKSRLARLDQKMFSPVAIYPLGYLRHPAIKSTHQSRYCLGGWKKALLEIRRSTFKKHMEKDDESERRGRSGKSCVNWEKLKRGREKIGKEEIEDRIEREKDGERRWKDREELISFI